MIALVDHGDPYRCPTQRPHRAETAEARTDYDDMRGGLLFCTGFGLPDARRSRRKGLDLGVECPNWSIIHWPDGSVVLEDKWRSNCAPPVVRGGWPNSDRSIIGVSA